MKEKITALLLVGTLLYGNGAAAAPEIKHSGNIVEITLKDAAVQPITFSVTEAGNGGPADSAESLYSIMEEIPDASGTVFFRFGIPTDSDTTDYSAYISDGENTQKLDFAFDWFAVRTLTDKINACSTGERINAELLKTENLEAMKMLGIDDFCEKTESVRTDIATALLEEKTSASADTLKFYEEYCIANAYAMINSNVKADVQKGLSLFKTDYPYQENDKLSNWILKKVSEQIPYSGIKALNNSYEKAYALYMINNARSDALTDLLSENAELLGLKGSTAYGNFAKLDNLKRCNVCDKLVLAMNASPAESSEAIMKMLSDAMAIKTADNIGGSGGGGGGGGTKISVDNSIYAVKPEQKKSNFNDMQSAQWAQEAVDALVERGAIAGYGDGAFRPDKQVTREEFVKMLVCICGIENKEAAVEFDDVNRNDWFYPYVASAFQSGIVKGVDSNFFGTGQLITRQDAAVILDRAADSCAIMLKPAYEDISFADSEHISEYAASAVKRLCANGIIKGMENNRFEPLQICSRAQAAKLLYELCVNFK